MAAPPALSARELWIKLLLYPSHTFPTAAAPVLVGIGLAVHDGVFAPVPALVAFWASWLIHVAGVFIDNHELLRRHPDVSEHPELLQALQTGTLTLAGLRGAIAASFALAALTVPYLVGIGGLPALVIGIVGAASSCCYAGGPLPYVKHGLAEVIFFAMFGIVAVAGTYYIQWAAVRGLAAPGVAALLELPPHVYFIGLPVGALVTNVMIIDDLRDHRFDAAKGWRTCAVRFGLIGGRAEYVALTALAYLLPLAFWAWLGYSAWVLLPLLTLPFAYRIAYAVCTRDEARDLLMMTPKAAYLSAAYALLLAAGMALPLH